MPDWVNTVAAWMDANRAIAVTVAVTLGLIVLSVAGSQVWAAYRGRSLTARASAGFAIVQAGVAYVTITGVYEFWAHRVDLPTWDAIGIALIIEAVTWAAVADIFVHGAGRDPAGKPNTGLGRSGPLFWASVTGGGVMAVVGSVSGAVAVGRSVVVVLGATMWYVRIMQRTRRRDGQGRWANPVKTTLLNWGWMISGDKDVTQTSREWDTRILARAIWQAAEGRRLGRTLGKRRIRRVLESGDVAMVQAAQQRYALQRLLRDELSPDTPSMAAAIEAVRAALTPPPTPEPAPVPEPPTTPGNGAEAPPEPPRRQVSARKRRTPPDKPGGDATAVRERAVAAAVDDIRNGAAPTGRTLGERFGYGDEWGRQRLTEARARIGSVVPDPAVNGHARTGL